jgi:Tol biopolymer transport system component
MSPRHVREELDRVLSSKAFADAERHRRFLRFVVEQTLDGRASEIKESVIGVEALGRNGSFDPKTDPIVRVEAGRLRARLSSYYETEGNGDPIRIELPKGGYVPEFTSLEAQPVIEARRWSRLTGALAGVAALLLVALTTVSFFHFREQAPERPVVRFEISAPEKYVVNIPFALSPDGRSVVVTLTPEDGGPPSLWVRAFDSVEIRRVPGTEGASPAAQPFWSPDSRFIGFFARSKLKKVDLSGGPVQTVCDAEDGVDGAWNRDGVIVFSRARSGIWRVPEAGGAVSQIAAVVPPEESYSASFLPDGRHFLYEIGRTFEANRTTFVATADGRTKKRLLSGTVGTVYAPPSFAGEKGHLLYLRADRTLMAQSFNEKRLESAGTAFPVTDNVAFFSASANGALAYRALASLFNPRQLFWFDRTGKRLAKVGPPGRYNGVALSPDASRVALARQDDSGNPDIWILDVHRDVATRSTFDASTDWEPVWSPDGKRLAFASRRDRGIDQIYWKDSSGAGNEEAVWNSAEGQRPEAWSPDGKFLLFMRQSENGSSHNLWTLPVDPGTPGAVHKGAPYFTSPFDITQGQFSPGPASTRRWVAYTSNESGQSQIFVQSFPAGAGKFQISTASGGGVQPRWRKDGKELFYLSLDRKLMAVEVKTAPTFEYGVPKELFQTPGFRAQGFPLVFLYDVTPDGNRFLVLSGVGGEGANSSPVTVVLNWASGLKR